MAEPIRRRQACVFAVAFHNLRLRGSCDTVCTNDPIEIVIHRESHCILANALRLRLVTCTQCSASSCLSKSCSGTPAYSEYLLTYKITLKLRGVHVLCPYTSEAALLVLKSGCEREGRKFGMFPVVTSFSLRTMSLIFSTHGKVLLLTMMDHGNSEVKRVFACNVAG